MSLKDERTILVVEDEYDLREIVKDLLEEKFSKVLTAADGVEAYELLKRQPVDLIFSDIRMPRMSGLELIRKIKADGIATPIILVSSAADREDVIIALKLGVRDFVEKPYEPETLLRTIYRVFEVQNRELELSTLTHLETADKELLNQKRRMIGLFYASNGAPNGASNGRKVS